MCRCDIGRIADPGGCCLYGPPGTAGGPEAGYRLRGSLPQVLLEKFDHVAQLDRAVPLQGSGCPFESGRGRLFSQPNFILERTKSKLPHVVYAGLSRPFTPARLLRNGI